MLFNDRIESLLILVRAHSYVSAGHPDFITVGRLQVWIRHAEFIVLDFPGPGPFPAHFTAEKHAIGTEITHPMGAIGNVVPTTLARISFSPSNLKFSCAY